MIGHQLVKGYLMWLHNCTRQAAPENAAFVVQLLSRIPLFWESIWVWLFLSLLSSQDGCSGCCAVFIDFFHKSLHVQFWTLRPVMTLSEASNETSLLVAFRKLFQTTYDWLHHWHKYVSWRPDPVIIWSIDPRKLITVWKPRRNTNDRSSLYIYDILPLTFKYLRCFPPERLVEGYNRYISWHGRTHLA